MSNNYFQFKEFRIEQGETAMKVSTDACIQGAWTPVEPQVKNVLDIGTGTGLLSLMLAQRSQLIHIDAVELDAESSLQAKANIANSPWNDRINIHNTDIKDFSSSRQYDLVICNPPFFQSSLLGDNEKRNNARHTLTLTYTDLIEATSRLLNEGGYISVLLPFAEHAIWEKIVKAAGWHIFQELHIKHTTISNTGRVVSLAAKEQRPFKQDTLVIYSAKDIYSTDFSCLLAPFYLKL